MSKRQRMHRMVFRSGSCPNKFRTSQLWTVTRCDRIESNHSNSIIVDCWLLTLAEHVSSLWGHLAKSLASQCQSLLLWQWMRIMSFNADSCICKMPSLEAVLQLHESRVTVLHCISNPACQVWSCRVTDRHFHLDAEIHSGRTGLDTLRLLPWLWNQGYHGISI